MRRAILLSLTGLLACGGGVIALAQDVRVDTLQTQLTFAAPVTAPNGAFALCLSFRRPGDSRDAAQLVVALRDSAGIADTLRGLPDRTGESTVCLRDSTTHAYVGATITAPRQMMLRQVDWRTPSRR